MQTFYEILIAVAKKLCPSSRKIAKSASKKAQSSYNGVDEKKRMMVAAYVTKGREIAAKCDAIAKMMENGTIDDMEREELENMFVPIIDAAKEMVFG